MNKNKLRMKNEELKICENLRKSAFQKENINEFFILNSSFL